jgi:hypothetical protein
VAERFQGAQHRKVTGQVRVEQIENVFRLLEVFQTVRTQVEQAGLCRQMVAHQVGGRLGEEYLAAVCHRTEASAAVHCRAVVIAIAQCRIARVQCYAYAKGCLGRPGLDTERLLESEGGGHSVGRVGEDGEEAVSLAALFDERAGVVGDNRGGEGVVAGERRFHRLGMLLPEACAALDVGEQKRDCSRWEGHGVIYQALVSLVGQRVPLPDP